MKEVFVWDGQCDRKNIDINLDKEGHEYDLEIIISPQEGKNLTININISHTVPNTSSRVNIRAAVADNSIVKISSLVTMEPGMKNTQTDLTAKGLLLAENSKMRIVPSVKVKERSARANHSVTISHIDQRELFYLATRGLSDEQAKTQIVKGFLLK